MFHHRFMDPLVHRIHESYELLPLGERKLAELILEMQGDLAAYSATELAARAGISKATAARLVRRLGYTDFQEMRQEARSHHGSPLAELSSHGAADGTMAQHLAHDLSTLRHALEAIQPEQSRAAVKILAEASRIVVVGFRNSYPLAFHACELLAQVRPNVRVLPMPGQTMSEQLADLGRADAVLAIGFRRRPATFGQVLGIARSLRARIVLLGDPSLGDIAKSAHVVFRCGSRGSGLFDSYVAPLSLLNFLCSGVALALETPAQQRLQHIESLHAELRDLEP
jgi:DNA-binding MurR/RpiR family transcriptional regulator